METPADRLKQLRERAGYDSPTQAMEAFGWPKGYYAHESGARGIRMDQAERYAAAFRSTAAYILFGDKKSNKPPLEHVASLSYKRIPVVGDVAAGAWLEADLFMDPHVTEYLPLHYDTKLPDDATFALRVRGNSLNKIAKDGSLLICISVQQANIAIQDGDLVIVQKHKGNLVEVTAKRIERVDGGYDLIPESTDPRWQERIPLRDLTDTDDGTVSVIARVEYILARPGKSSS